MQFKSYSFDRLTPTFDDADFGRAIVTLLYRPESDVPNSSVGFDIPIRYTAGDTIETIERRVGAEIKKLIAAMAGDLDGVPFESLRQRDTEMRAAEEAAYQSMLSDDPA